MGRPFALLEVLIVFAITSSAFKMIRIYTAWGRFESEHALNFTPGLCMIVATIILWAIQSWRRSW